MSVFKAMFEVYSPQRGQAEVVMENKDFNEQDLFALDGTFGEFTEIKEIDENEFRLFFTSRHKAGYYITSRKKCQ